MSDRLMTTLSRWSLRGAAAGVALALALPLGAYIADLAWGRDVLLLVPFESSVVALNRSLWGAGEPVADLYGTPTSATTRVLLLDESALLRPGEDPTLALLPVSGPGARPLQTRTLWWAVRLAEAGLGAAVGALLILGRSLSRRERLRARPANTAQLGARSLS